jgi:murein peptide amidase A
MTGSRRVAALAGAAMALTGCGPAARRAGAPATTTTAVPVSTTAVAATTTGLSTTTSAPATPAPVEIGRSVEGRPIEAIERGEPGGQVVLVIGCIHGDEAAGVAVAEQLAAAPVPPGIDVWIVPTMNPDGQAHDTRTNANQVDLNRNFPFRWAPLQQPGGSEYAGPRAASEPETKAVVALVSRVEPALTIWYHQDLNRIAPATGRPGRVRRRYAELTALPVLAVTGGTYTGTASPWAENNVSGVSFIVELGPSLTDQQVATHAAAVLTVASELGSI